MNLERGITAGIARSHWQVLLAGLVDNSGQVMNLERGITVEDGWQVLLVASHLLRGPSSSVGKNI